MKKPIDYSQRKCRTLPKSEIPKSWKDWERYRRIIAVHPEWKDLSDEEFQKAHDAFIQESRRKAVEKARTTVAAMDPQRKAEINKKKGSFYNNMTPEEKLKHNEVLRQRSNKFWQGMSEEEKHRFSRYRESLVPEDVKQARNKRFFEGSKRYFESLTKEDIDAQVARMNAAYKKKFETDEDFRNEQIALLRKHNIEFWESLTDEEKHAIWDANGQHAAEVNRQKWETDPKYREKMYNHLCNIAKMGADAIRDKWNTDDEFRESMNKQLQDMRDMFFMGKSNKEKYVILQRNKLNERFEKRFNESILAESFYYIPEFPVKSPTGEIKSWDYGIFDENGELVMVVDLDGAYYHADKCDYDGLRSAEEFDERRGSFIPAGVMVEIIQEGNFLDTFKQMIKDLSMDYDGYIKKIFDTLRSQPFPYPRYSPKELLDSYSQLGRLDPNNKYLTLSIRNREGDRLIQHFHHNIYHANVKGRISPYNAWYDDKLLKKCIENRTIYQNHLNPNKILQGFNISKIATKVSVFSAGRAKIIIDKYLSEFNTIFDPFSGFSGRLLGTISLDKKYIGQDINEITVRESNNLIKFLQDYYKFDATVVQKDVLTSSGQYPCLFTCPPYGDKEQWEGTPVDRRTCDDWIDICLERFKCKRYVFVVDTTTKYAQYIVDEITNKSHLSNAKEYIICIDREG